MVTLCTLHMSARTPNREVGGQVESLLKGAGFPCIKVCIVGARKQHH